MLELRRVIIFCGDVERCGAFYRDVLGLKVLPSEHPPHEWMELEAGGCRLALHQAYRSGGPIREPTGGADNPHKIVFYASDVAATREDLIRRGAPMEPLKSLGDLHLCDGSDPEGHRFQISSR